MATLAYIDVKNLAHRIKGEVKMITGLDDDVCYPITQFAIYNRLTCDKAYRIMPEYAHEAMNVFVNDQCLQLAMLVVRFLLSYIK